MTNRQDRGSVAHAAHDALLIATYAAGDAEPAESSEAERLIATCSECAELANDIRLIAHATSELPPQPRPRDFTITAEQAARLRHGGWRRAIASMGWVRNEIGRTLAAGLTTLGLAGLLLGSVPTLLSAQTGGSAGAAPIAASGSGGPTSEAEGQNGDLLAPVPGASRPAPAATRAGTAAPSSLGEQLYGPDRTQRDSYGPGIAGDLHRSPASGAKGDAEGLSSQATSANDQTLSARSAAQSQNAPAQSSLIVLSIAFLALGLALFALRRFVAGAAR